MNKHGGSPKIVWKKDCWVEPGGTVEFRCILRGDGESIFEKATGRDSLGVERWVDAGVPREFLNDAAGLMFEYHNEKKA